MASYFETKGRRSMGDPVESRVREVLHDISFFEQYALPQSPPETPPMKGDAQFERLGVKERVPMHTSLDVMFPRTPPHSPQGLKRKLSSNLKSALASVLPMTPPASPPTNVGLGLRTPTTLEKTMSDSVNQAHQISIQTIKSRPTIVTIDVTGTFSRRVSDATEETISRRNSLRRSSSYSSASSMSSKDPMNRLKEYSARSIEGRYPSPTLAPPPAYSPPTNTPVAFTNPAQYSTPLKPIEKFASVNEYAGGVRNHGVRNHGASGKGQGGQEAPVDNDPFNPFSYTGPTQYPNHSHSTTQQSNGFQQGYAAQYPGLPSPGTYHSQNPGIVELEKARSFGQPEQPEKKKRSCCGCGALVCCLLVLTIIMVIVVAIVVAIVVIKHKHDSPPQLEKHIYHSRSTIPLDGLYIRGRRVPGSGTM